jgi:hypothetical protein
MVASHLWFLPHGCFSFVIFTPRWFLIGDSFLHGTGDFVSVIPYLMMAFHWWFFTQWVHRLFLSMVVSHW